MNILPITFEIPRSIPDGQRGSNPPSDIVESVKEEVKCNLGDKDIENPFRAGTHLYNLLNLVEGDFPDTFYVGDICKAGGILTTIWSTIYTNLNGRLHEIGINKRIFPLGRSGACKGMYIYCNPDELDNKKETYLSFQKQQFTSGVANIENPFKRDGTYQKLFSFFQKNEGKVVLYTDLIDIIGERGAPLSHQIRRFNLGLEIKGIAFRAFSFGRMSYERGKYIFCNPDKFSRLKAEYLFENGLESIYEKKGGGGGVNKILPTEDGYKTLIFGNSKVQEVYDFFLQNFGKVVTRKQLEEKVDLGDSILGGDILRRINTKLRRYGKVIKSIGNKAGERGNYIMCDEKNFQTLKGDFIKLLPKIESKTGKGGQKGNNTISKTDTRPGAILKNMFYGDGARKSYTNKELTTKMRVNIDKLEKAAHNLNTRYGNEMGKWIVREGDNFILTEIKPSPKRTYRKRQVNNDVQVQEVQLSQEKACYIKFIGSSRICYNLSTLELEVGGNVWYIDEEPMKTLIGEYMQSEEFLFPFKGNRRQINEFCYDMGCPFFVTKDGAFVYSGD